MSLSREIAATIEDAFDECRPMQHQSHDIATAIMKRLDINSIREALMLSWERA